MELQNNSLIQSLSDSVAAPTVVPSNDQQPKTNSFLVILLSILLIISVAISGFFAYQTQKLVKELTALKTEEKVVPEAMEEPTTEPVATADSTASWNPYKGDGFQVMYPNTWQGLKNSCQSISITKSEAVQLELDIKEYVRQTMSFSDVTDLDQIINVVDQNSKFKFKNVQDKDVVVLGPQGMNEINNIFVRGPGGTGYFNIFVMYIGPAPDINKECMGDKIIEYKDILSTFKFTN